MPMKFTCVLASLLSVSLACLQTYGIYSINNNNKHKTQITRDKKKCEQPALQARACHVALFVVIFVIVIIIVFGCSNIVG